MPESAAAADRAAVVARVHDHPIRQLEQPRNRRVQLPCERLRITAGVQVRPADVADEQRVAGENEPWLLGRRGDGRRRRRRVSRRVARASRARARSCCRARPPRRRHGTCVELDPGTGRKVGGRARRFDERRQAGDVVGLHVRLEDGDDRRAEPLGLGQVLVDELDVRIDDGQRSLREAAEQVARARGRLVQERAEDHRSQGRAARYHGQDECPDGRYRLDR